MHRSFDLAGRTCAVFLATSLATAIGGCSSNIMTGQIPAREITTTGSACNDSVLRVATLNMWGVVVPVLNIPVAHHIDERFDALADRLQRNDPCIDIVLLQEMWKTSARKKLLTNERLAAVFPYQIDGVDLFGKNGLVVLSRFPVVDNKVWFHRFRRRGRWWALWQGDYYGGKGVLAFQAQVADQRVWIMNTHLIACYPQETEVECDQYDGNGRYRWDQVHAVRDFVADLTATNPALIGGDFNFTRSSRYHLAMRRPGLHDSLQRSDDFADTLTRYSTDIPWHEVAEPDAPAEQLDYVWARPGTELSWATVEQTRRVYVDPVRLADGNATALSDHPALVTGFCLARSDNPGENDCQTF